MGFHASVGSFDRKGAVLGSDLGIGSDAILEITDNIKRTCANDTQFLV